MRRGWRRVRGWLARRARRDTPLGAQENIERMREQTAEVKRLNRRIHGTPLRDRHDEYVYVCKREDMP